MTPTFEEISCCPHCGEPSEEKHKPNRKMKFPKLVIDEATALKKHATEEEINNLDFSKLNPENFRECIYGQMTGDCFCDRAVELIQKCATRVYDNEEYKYLDSYNKKVSNGVKLNGSPHGKARDDYFSPIEVFISRHPSKNGAGKLIQFIKGEIKSL